MIINFNDNVNIKKSIVTFGNFDGVHIGHKFIINELKKISSYKKAKSILITFNPHTNSIINKKIDIHQLITDYDYKIDLLDKEMIDFISIVDFNVNFSKITYTSFVNEILQKYNPSHILIGYDNKFGYKAEGNFESLTKYIKSISRDIKVLTLNEVKQGSMKVKSSIIKGFINSGDIKIVNKMLGRKFKLFGKIVKGNKVGNMLGFPTANLEVLNKQQIIPKVGVYYVNFVVGKNRYKSLCNIGFKPTFGNDNKLSIETHILNEEEFDLYNLNVELEFIDYIRDEIKFKNKDFLIEQINKDIIKVNKIN